MKNSNFFRNIRIFGNGKESGSLKIFFQNLLNMVRIDSSRRAEHEYQRDFFPNSRNKKLWVFEISKTKGGTLLSENGQKINFLILAQNILFWALGRGKTFLNSQTKALVSTVGTKNIFCKFATQAY